MLSRTQAVTEIVGSSGCVASRLGFCAPQNWWVSLCLPCETRLKSGSSARRWQRTSCSAALTCGLRLWRVPVLGQLLKEAARGVGLHIPIRRRGRLSSREDPEVGGQARCQGSRTGGDAREASEAPRPVARRARCPTPGLVDHFDPPWEGNQETVTQKKTHPRPPQSGRSEGFGRLPSPDP